MDPVAKILPDGWNLAAITLDLNSDQLKYNWKFGHAPIPSAAGVANWLFNGTNDHAALAAADTLGFFGYETYDLSFSISVWLVPYDFTDSNPIMLIFFITYESPSEIFIRRVMSVPSINNSSMINH